MNFLWIPCFLIFFLLVSIPYGYGFKTDLLNNQDSIHVGKPIHQEITREALSFLKKDVLDNIVNEHPDVEITHGLQAKWHFDDCRFSETSNLIKVWEGERLNKIQAKKISGVKEIFYLEELY